MVKAYRHGDMALEIITEIPKDLNNNIHSPSFTPTKETKQAIGEYPCKVCGQNFTEKKTSMLCEQNHYLKDIADTLRTRL